ncbi:MAG: YibE/F family protein [Oscillospiraceae bacterium]|nr:YibE/F family protein [Oscillospiraceae bacterium]
MANQTYTSNSSPAQKNRVMLIAVSLVFASTVIVVFIINHNNPINYSLHNNSGITYEKASVTAVLEENLTADPDLPGQVLGMQKIRIKFKNGQEKGRETELEHSLFTTHSVLARKGQSLVIRAERLEDIDPYYSVYSYDRTPGWILAIIIFTLFMLAVGRIKGLRSVLGLAASLFFIVALLLPSVYHGHSPVLMSMLTGIIIATFSLILLNGLSRRTFTALAATGAGILLSGLFFGIVSSAMSLTGYDITEAEELIMVSRQTGLGIGQVLFAGIIIASLGAVMDTTVSLTAAVYEIREKKPEIAAGELFISGMNIGKDIIGANCMTLILAFAGSSFATLLSLTAYGTQFDQLMSSNYIAVEIAYGVTGSLAVVASVPVTAGLCILKSVNKPGRA